MVHLEKNTKRDSEFLFTIAEMNLTGILIKTLIDYNKKKNFVVSE